MGAPLVFSERVWSEILPILVALRPLRARGGCHGDGGRCGSRSGQRVALCSRPSPSLGNLGDAGAFHHALPAESPPFRLRRGPPARTLCTAGGGVGSCLSMVFWLLVQGGLGTGSLAAGTLLTSI